MTRPLGSFNEQVNLPSHPEDHQRASQPRVASIKFEKFPIDRLGETGGEKFVQGRGRSGYRPERRRFAGNALNVDLRNLNSNFDRASNGVKFSPGLRQAFAPPIAGAAESRTSITPL